MKRLQVLLLAGLAALPSGCLVLPQSDALPLPPPLADVKPTAAAELPAPQSAKVCLATGAFLEKQGYETEALLEYQRARQYDPRLPGVAWRLAVLYGKLGETEKARTEFQTALQEQPRDAALLNDLGFFHYQLNENGAAEKSLRQALALNSSYQRAWVNLGKVLVQQHRSRAGDVRVSQWPYAHGLAEPG